MKLLITIFLVLSITTSLYALEISSSYYTLDLGTFAQGGGPLSSTNNVATYSCVGESIGSLTESISNKFSLLAGQLYLILPLAPWKAVLISDLRARTEVLGPLITEALWQKDNDPYFYWSVVTEPEQIVSGFSVSLDAKPAHQINTTATYYQFPATPGILSGKHTFYVLPFTSDKDWDENSLLKFEIWVDAEPPIASQMRPAPGEITANNIIPISCNLYDVDSGIDPTMTSLTLNGNTLYFTYDAANRLLKFTPASPLSEGKNTVILKVYDMVGNYVVKGWDFIVDTQPPSGGIKINNAEEVTHSAYVFINIEAKESVSGIKAIYLSNDGVFDTELNSPYPYAPLISNWLLAEPDVDGNKTVYAKFEDLAGNFSPTYQASITLRLLTPDTRIISGPVSSTEETAANFKYEASKPNCKFSYKLDNQEWSAWSVSTEASFSGLATGNHYFYVKSGFDLNGNDLITIDEEDATPSQWVWTVKGRGEIEKEKEKILFWRR